MKRLLKHLLSLSLLVGLSFGVLSASVFADGDQPGNGEGEETTSPANPGTSNPSTPTTPSTPANPSTPSSSNQVGFGANTNDDGVGDNSAGNIAQPGGSSNGSSSQGGSSNGSSSSSNADSGTSTRSDSTNNQSNAGSSNNNPSNTSSNSGTSSPAASDSSMNQDDSAAEDTGDKEVAQNGSTTIPKLSGDNAASDQANSERQSNPWGLIITFIFVAVGVAGVAIVATILMKRNLKEDAASLAFEELANSQADLVDTEDSERTKA